MAYENYSFVSWTDGTPLSSDRLAQMSLNIEQIRDANDSKPQGILEYIENTSGQLVANVTTNVQILALTNPNGGTDQRVTVDQNRYYRVTCTFPGFTISGRGAEDCTLSLKIWDDVSSGYGATSPKAVWNFTAPPYAFYNTAANANTQVLTVKSSDTVYVGAGTYSIVLASGGGLTAESFSVSVERLGGTSNLTNAPQVSVVSSQQNRLQLMVEDVGATV